MLDRAGICALYGTTNDVVSTPPVDSGAGAKGGPGGAPTPSAQKTTTKITRVTGYVQRLAEIEALKVANKAKIGISEIQAKVDGLQSQKAAGTEMLLSPEQLAEEKAWRAQITQTNKDIRELQKDLKREKDALSSNVTMLNILVIPLLIAIIGVIVQMRRRSVTEAR